MMENLNALEIDNSTLMATMTGQQYRALVACKATKDVRYYLDGIHLNHEHRQAVSTNGHILYFTDIDAGEQLTEDIIFEAVKVPVSVGTVTVERFDENNVLVKTYNKSNMATAQHVCKIVDGRYPDYVAIIPNPTDKEEPFNSFSFDVKYLALLQTIYGKGTPVKFHMKTSNRCALINAVDTSKGTTILMPCSFK